MDATRRDSVEFSCRSASMTSFFLCLDFRACSLFLALRRRVAGGRGVQHVSACGMWGHKGSGVAGREVMAWSWSKGSEGPQAA